MAVIIVSPGVVAAWLGNRLGGRSLLLLLLLLKSLLRVRVISCWLHLEGLRLILLAIRIVYARRLLCKVIWVAIGIGVSGVRVIDKPCWLRLLHELVLIDRVPEPIHIVSLLVSHIHAGGLRLRLRTGCGIADVKK